MTVKLVGACLGHDGVMEDSVVGENCPLNDNCFMVCSNVLSGIQQGIFSYGWAFFLLKNRASRDTQNSIQKPLLKRYSVWLPWAKLKEDKMFISLEHWVATCWAFFSEKWHRKITHFNCSAGLYVAGNMVYCRGKKKKRYFHYAIYFLIGKCFNIYRKSIKWS